jgi:hypothetical protein
MECVSICILISSAKRTSIATWIFKGKPFIYIIKTKGAPELIPEGLSVLFPYMKFIYLLVSSFIIGFKYFNKL